MQKPRQHFSDWLANSLTRTAETQAQNRINQSMLQIFLAGLTPIKYCKFCKECFQVTMSQPTASHLHLETARSRSAN
jgi:hypothetical protein